MKVYICENDFILENSVEKNSTIKILLLLWFMWLVVKHSVVEANHMYSTDCSILEINFLRKAEIINYSSWTSTRSSDNELYLKVVSQGLLLCCHTFIRNWVKFI